MKNQILQDFEEEWAKYIVSMPEMATKREKEKAFQNAIQEMFLDGILTEEEVTEVLKNQEAIMNEYATQLTTQAKEKAVKWWNSHATERHQLASEKALFAEIMQKVDFESMDDSFDYEMGSHESKSGQVERLNFCATDFEFAEIED